MVFRSLEINLNGNKFDLRLMSQTARSNNKHIKKTSFFFFVKVSGTGRLLFNT